MFFFLQFQGGRPFRPGIKAVQEHRPHHGGIKIMFEKFSIYTLYVCFCYTLYVYFCYTLYVYFCYALYVCFCYTLYVCFCYTLYVRNSKSLKLEKFKVGKDRNSKRSTLQKFEVRKIIINVAKKFGRIFNEKDRS